MYSLDICSLKMITTLKNITRGGGERDRETERETDRESDREGEGETERDRETDHF